MAVPGDAATPAWLPASVGSAYRRGIATDEDLSSGAALRSMLDAVARAGAVVTSPRCPSGAIDRAAGVRHLLVLLALAADEALRPSDPYDPHIRPANVDAVLKWGMDCPDAAYSGAAIRGDAGYRVYGTPGTARYVGLQVMSGIAATANVVLGELAGDRGGRVELLLSPEAPAPEAGAAHPINWVQLPPDATSLVVRQFFYDWTSEEPARLDIECLRSPAPTRQAEPLSAAGVARKLVAVGEFVEASIGFWLDVEDSGRAQGVNVFRPPVNPTEMGAAAESVTVWGSWELEPDEALVIEVTPPDALYWSISLGNHWWETIDYAARQTSLNGFQAVIDDDGVFRAVVCQRDPGIANWLDTAGHRQGPAICRWVRADGAPVPTTQVVKVDDVATVLPPGTKRLDAAARQATIAARRAGVRRRFAR